MKIGRLRHVIALQDYSEIQDSMNGTIRKWVTTQQVFAEIIPKKGYINFMNQQLETATTHEITIRYQPYITSEKWIQFQNRRFRIRNVTNLLEKNRFLILKCEEVFYAEEYFEVGQASVGDPLTTEIYLNPYMLMNYYSFILMSGEQFNLMG
jgi:SPP1 family predicted phage head-tail adaptor